MHLDESRDPESFDRREFEWQMADPERLRDEHRQLEKANAALELVAKTEKDRAARAEHTVRVLQRRALRAEQSLAEERAKHGTTAAKLKAYRKEVDRLKNDLKKLRGSVSLRVGRGFLSPLTATRSAARSLGYGVRADDVPALEVPIQVVTTAHEAPSATVPVAKPAALKLSDLTTPELLEWFQDAPDGARLGTVLSRLWFVEGDFSRASDLLERHSDLVPDLPARNSHLADRIPGAVRTAATIESMVPPRSPGAAYVAEADRVMYCVNQTPIYTTNGYATRTEGVAESLADNGWDVRVVSRLGYPWDVSAAQSPKKRERTAVEQHGIEYVHHPDGDLSRQPRDHYLLAAADAFVREARLYRPSVIQAASNHIIGLAALIAARRLGIPFVYEVRGLWELSEASSRPGWETSEKFALQVRLETLVAQEADRVLVITDQVREELIRRGVSPELIDVAPNAVDPYRMLPLPKDEAFAKSKGITTDRPVIGFAGSMVPYEGLDVLLRAAAHLRDRGGEFQIVLAGGGSAEASLKDLCTELGLDDHVKFLGRLPSSVIPRLISTFTIMPCPRKSEIVTELVSPLKPIEAFAAAKAVVLSDVAPHRSLAGDREERAALFPSGDDDALADLLEALLNDSDRCAALGRAGRLWTLDERSWNKVGSRMIVSLRKATDSSTSNAQAAEAATLGELRVGIIADEFTTETLRPSVQLVPLMPETWAEQLAAENLDMVLVESAWKGNGGAWHRKVGYYDDDSFADLSGLLDTARSRGIASVFWNKEDPIHFKRFSAAAALCDHVFTTDAHKIPDYLSTPERRSLTASSMPFYAQPAIHNPLASTMPVRDTVTYAGTFYGKRYAERSEQLLALLDGVVATGLTIYDRQHDDPDSPYRFPAHLLNHVEGAIPYREVLGAYKSHIANINVNSVEGSPTMFSRRVVEIASSGGVVLSGPGRGMEEVLGDLIPVSRSRRRTQALVSAWSQMPSVRLAEAWRQMRGVLRAHTVDTALTIMARTAGLRIQARGLPSYALVLGTSDPELMKSVLAQSVRPAEVVLLGSYDGQAREACRAAGVEIVESVASLRSEWVGQLQGAVFRTWAEDLLWGTRFGEWRRLDQHVLADGEDSRPMTRAHDVLSSDSGLIRRELLRDGDVLEACREQHGPALQMVVPPDAPVEKGRPASGTASSALLDRGALTVLVAGHDLKFTGGWLEHLRAQGHTVLVDDWQSHTSHDENRSLELLEQADVVFCEWGLGNLQWYSHQVKAHQRLVTRVHLQELDRPYLARTRHAAVDSYIFVGELIRRAAVESHGVPEEKTGVIPNIVDVEDLDRAKSPEARFTIGFVGMVPQRKRVDLALDVLEKLRQKDRRYRLRVKGKSPQDFPWMKNRPQEMDFYNEIEGRVDALNSAEPGSVVFDGFGSDMGEWYSEVGIVISVSDFESFHLTIADGAASGAVPASLDWDGADLIYPREWLSADVEEMADRIHHKVVGLDDDARRSRTRRDKDVIRAQMGQDRVYSLLEGALVGAPDRR